MSAEQRQLLDALHTLEQRPLAAEDWQEPDLELLERVLAYLSDLRVCLVN